MHNTFTSRSESDGIAAGSTMSHYQDSAARSFRTSHGKPGERFADSVVAVRSPVIPVYRPYLDETDREMVADCIERGWVSSAGPMVGQFEDAFAERCGVRNAVAVSSGTAALHLLLQASGVGVGDEVLV